MVQDSSTLSGKSDIASTDPTETSESWSQDATSPSDQWPGDPTNLHLFQEQ